MIGKVKEEGLIQLLLVGKKKLELTHLQFADNTILFCLDKVKTVNNYKRIMDCFGIMVGLSINYDK